ncbi:hypothetical protein LWI29_012448 [Acer saccharum]|uniref:Peptidase A1 domain-containing protein n=1 Tax=Acer saccharum TaxID=4024 RepID=A0AA39SXC8_ACESA|nr:hypothetical protein LWI29_012448 [Acer saccharum]
MMFFYYAGQVGIGTPPRMVWVMIDTGGGLIWTQCQPCIDCFNQDYTIFNPRTSSTYRRLPCNHYLFSGPNSRFKCVDKEYCTYDARYGRGRTKGVCLIGEADVEIVEATAIYKGMILTCALNKKKSSAGVQGHCLTPTSLSKLPLQAKASTVLSTVSLYLTQHNTTHFFMEGLPESDVGIVEREELMVSPSGDGEPTMRVAHFLQPTVTSIEGPVFELPSSRFSSLPHTS